MCENLCPPPDLPALVKPADPGGGPYSYTLYYLLLSQTSFDTGLRTLRSLEWWALLPKIKSYQHHIHNYSSCPPFQTTGPTPDTIPDNLFRQPDLGSPAQSSPSDLLERQHLRRVPESQCASGSLPVPRRRDLLSFYPKRQDLHKTVQLAYEIRSIHAPLISCLSLGLHAGFLLSTILDGPRLAFRKRPGVETLSVGSEFIKNIWVPDTFFVNEKQSSFHIATTLNEFIRIHHSGSITRSIRIIEPIRAHHYCLMSDEPSVFSDGSAALSY
ncbi:hypothetical protein NQ318_007351 [Aromia moschata]|uniref:Neurotransmitter-gated ion-channel ligand-binding domain-containing protein n=1 Tax=Aromia moschata TaxID=1265417 RepID=A0AAV8YZ70_9CUCU|nr:hypothetical protein NQ318_007351 [Aromia moschata]